MGYDNCFLIVSAVFSKHQVRISWQSNQNHLHSTLFTIERLSKMIKILFQKNNFLFFSFFLTLLCPPFSHGSDNFKLRDCFNEQGFLYYFNNLNIQFSSCDQSTFLDSFSTDSFLPISTFRLTEHSNFYIEPFFNAKIDDIFFYVSNFHSRDKITFSNKEEIHFLDFEDFPSSFNSFLSFLNSVEKKDKTSDIEVLDSFVLNFFLFKHSPLPLCEDEVSPSKEKSDKSSIIPAAAWLLCLGILGLVLIRKRVMH